MQNKLLTLSALVDHLQYHGGEPLEDLIEINNWSDFLKQTVKLGDFIPCGEDGKPIDRPTKNRKDHTLSGHHSYTRGLEAYQKAQAAVLFEGWEIKANDTYDSGVQCIVISNNLGLTISFEYREEKINIKAKKDGARSNITTYAKLANATQENPLTIKNKQSSKQYHSTQTTTSD